MGRLWHISDTHMNHEKLVVPPDIDIVVHSGDASNARDPYRNESELVSFLCWFSGLSIPNKVFVPGNHDTSLERGLIKREWVESLGINLLLTEERTIDGLKFWGSPYTPRFGDWAFMKDRSKINSVWEEIPEAVDVVVTHGPPYGVLDATYTRSNTTELVGCRALMKQLARRQVKFVLFGHIHATADIRNAGTRTIGGSDTVYSNGSCCDDGKMGIVTSHGNILQISK